MLRHAIVITAALGTLALASGCALAITAAQMSGKLPSTASVIDAAVRTAGALSGPAGETRTIASGEARQGALTEESEQLEDGSYFAAWFYSAAGGETIQIDLWSEDFQPYLILGFMEGGMEGSFVQVAATGGEEEPSPVRLVETLEQPGTYAIIANAFEPGELGTYRLRVIAAE